MSERTRAAGAGAGNRMENWYRRLLTLYPKDHRREHAEEMVGVLLAAAGQGRAPAARLAGRAQRLGQHAADSADLIGGALRIRGRMALNRVKRIRWPAWTVRDERWSDALAVVSVVTPLLLLAAALTEFRIHWRLSETLTLADLPMAAGAPGVIVLAFLRPSRSSPTCSAGRRSWPPTCSARPGPARPSSGPRSRCSTCRRCSWRASSSPGPGSPGAGPPDELIRCAPPPPARGAP